MSVSLQISDNGLAIKMDYLCEPSLTKFMTTLCLTGNKSQKKLNSKREFNYLNYAKIINCLNFCDYFEVSPPNIVLVKQEKKTQK